MKQFNNLMGTNLKDCEEWKNCDILYNNFLNELHIPKKIHQIWLGESIPDTVNDLALKIKELHPNWEYKLWRDDDLTDYPLKNRELYDNTLNLGSKSDIARYEILLNEGGIYLDTDFLMVKSFDKLLKNDFFTGTGGVEDPEVFNGLIGCIPNHDLMVNIVNGLSNTRCGGDIMFTTGPYYFSSKVFEYIKNNLSSPIVVLPTPYFYPLSRHERFKIRNNTDTMMEFITSFNTEETICIHLWHTSWQ